MEQPPTSTFEQTAGNKFPKIMLTRNIDNDDVLLACQSSLHNCIRQVLRKWPVGSVPKYPKRITLLNVPISVQKILFGFSLKGTTIKLTDQQTMLEFFATILPSTWHYRNKMEHSEQRCVNADFCTRHCETLQVCVPVRIQCDKHDEYKVVISFRLEKIGFNGDKM